PGAHSYDGSGRCWNVASVEEYIGGAPAQGERLTDRDRRNEYVMTRLRTAEGIDLGEFGKRFGPDRLGRLLRAAESSIQTRRALVDGQRLKNPPERFLVSDQVIETLFEA
ncbi:MAG: coproporphyrinogen III oxidase family protein, partial [Alistipes sp.]|nr:coproporphyrinogen III oxidase family protein [Alistipes sp.]